MSKPFVHLHNHSDYSPLDGYSRAEEYVQQAKKLGQPGVGLTDHGTPAGAFDLITACNKHGITPIIGMEAYLAPIGADTAFPKRPIHYGNGKDGDVSGGGAYTHISLLAYTTTGLENLNELFLLSTGVERFYRKPRISFQDLAEHQEGIIVATGCPSGEILTRLRLGQTREAYQFASDLRDIFTDRLYVELMDHHMSQDLERKTLNDLKLLANKLSLPLLATNDCHYAHAEDAHTHRVMLAIQTGSDLSEPPLHKGGKRFDFDGDEYYLKPSQVMWDLFPEDIYPGACANTLHIREMAASLALPEVEHPRPAPPNTGEHDTKPLRAQAIAAIPSRYGDTRSPELEREIMNRIDEEIRVIESSDFTDYFRVVRSLIQYVRENHSFTDDEGNICMSAIGPGRGSVGGSIVAYLLGISQVDPIRHDLLFSRFLTAGRGMVYRLTLDNGETLTLNAGDRVQTPEGECYVHEAVNGKREILSPSPPKEATV